MAGLVEVGTGAKLEDSNMARYGGEEMRALREKAASTESAWDGCGQEVGLEVWRIEDFKVVRWPKEDYGSFYSGDSYIVLNTWKEDDSDALNYDVHFWIGESSSQDEFGVAAYKTVELDDLFGDRPVQHREVQGHESKKFLGYWTKYGAMKILEGGVDSGFHHVEPTEYKPRLLQCSKVGKQTRMVQVELSVASMHHGDVFVLDAGLKLYIFRGSDCSAFEGNKAAQICAAIDSERGGRCEVVQEPDDEFWAAVGGTADDVGPAKASDEPQAETSKLFRLTEKEGGDGAVEFTEVKTGDLKMADLDTNDVFIVDNNVEIFIWVGAGASKAEKRYAMPRANEYVVQFGRPAWLPFTRVCEGGETPLFLKEME